MGRLLRAMETRHFENRWLANSGIAHKNGTSNPAKSVVVNAVVTFQTSSLDKIVCEEAILKHLPTGELRCLFLLW
jgi:hypothetical protein